jgi:hypothetical protein
MGQALMEQEHRRSETEVRNPNHRAWDFGVELI